MDCAGALARHYATEALRLFQGAAVNDELRLAQKTLAWLRDRGKEVFYLSELYQFGPAAIQNKTAAEKIVGVLSDHGYLEPVAVPRSAGSGDATFGGWCQGNSENRGATLLNLLIY
jgi:hypothetical protein